MPFLYFDAETYYDTDFSLTKLGNEQYVLDKRFELNGAAFALDDDKAVFYDRRELIYTCRQLDWNKIILVCHNTLFDGSIIVWHLHHIPRLFADTLGMANYFIRPFTGRSSLDACAAFENLPLKSGILKEIKGLRAAQIKNAGLWDRYAEYACQDLDNCRYIFKKYYPQMTAEEKLKLDWTTRNYVRGRLRINVSVMQQAYDDATAKRDELLKEAGIIDKKTVSSRPQFVKHLEWLGVAVEYKDGKNGEIPAISKNDAFVADLLKHPDHRVVAATKARLAFSSTIEVSRAKRLIDLAVTTGGKMLLPMVYAAAHTGRPGGTDRINVTNFLKGSKVREAIHVPDGYVLLDVDASQVEARICAWLADCERMLAAFRDPNRDVYCEYASETLYHRPITKGIDNFERQIAKVEVLALQYGVGWETLLKRLILANIALDETEARRHVYAYRNGYPEILGNGKEFCEHLIWAVENNKTCMLKGMFVTPHGIMLPNSYWLKYPQLQLQGRELMYYSARYKSWQKLYPGAINENLCQALANAVVGRALVRFRDDAILFIYDSVVRLVRQEAYAEESAKTLSFMTTPPSWAADLPLAAEAKLKRHL